MMATKLGSVTLVLAAKLLSVAGKHMLNDATEIIWKKCNKISHEVLHFHDGDYTSSTIETRVRLQQLVT
jgi:hypothetical protein